MLTRQMTQNGFQSRTYSWAFSQWFAERRYWVWQHEHRHCRAVLDHSDFVLRLYWKHAGHAQEKA